MAEPAAALPVARYFTEIMDDRTHDLQIMLDILQEVGAREQFVLVGGLAVGYYGRERATMTLENTTTPVTPAKGVLDGALQATTPEGFQGALRSL